MTPARRARYSRIERIVDGLVEGVHAAPVPVEAMVRAHGITLRSGDLGEDVSGLLIRGGDGADAIIGVNATQPRTRRRFTIAHEFGHFLLHEGISEHVDQGYRVNFRSGESALATNVEEIEANFFAASLLMPRRLLDAHGAIEAVDSDSLVGQLAATFEVSRHAMSLRLANVYREHAPY